MPFFGELLQSELFKNSKYLELKEKGELANTHDTLMPFIHNIWNLAKDIALSKDFLGQLQKHYILFESDLGKYLPASN